MIEMLCEILRDLLNVGLSKPALLLFLKIMLIPILLSYILVFPFKRVLGGYRGLVFYLIFAAISSLILFSTIYFTPGGRIVSASCDVGDQYTGSSWNGEVHQAPISTNYKKATDACGPIDINKIRGPRYGFTLFIFYILILLFYVFLRFVTYKFFIRR